MLCAFDGPPRIVRLHGRGEMLPLDDVGGGVRAVVRVHVERVSDSCGYGVPLMEYVGEKNSVSIDGLPAFDQRST